MDDQSKMDAKIRYYHEEQAMGVARAVLREFARREVRARAPELLALGVSEREISQMTEAEKLRREALEAELVEPRAYVAYVQAAREEGLLPSHSEYLRLNKSEVR